MSEAMDIVMIMLLCIAAGCFTVGLGIESRAKKVYAYRSQLLDEIGKVNQADITNAVALGKYKDPTFVCMTWLKRHDWFDAVEFNSMMYHPFRSLDSWYPDRAQVLTPVYVLQEEINITDEDNQDEISGS